jgi:hypothetical protein
MPARNVSSLRFAFDAAIVEWRGPSPFFFVPVSPGPSAEIRRVAKFVTYGWGVIPVQATIAGVTFTTSLFPRDGIYLLPLKIVVRRKANITAGDRVAVAMTIVPAGDSNARRS